MTINVTTSFLQKHSIMIAQIVALLYVQQTLRFTTIRQFHVRPAYSFRTQTTFIYARENYCFAIRHRSCKRHGALGAYFFPERQTITLRCPNSDNQPPHTMSPQGAGLAHNLLTCHLSSSTLRTLPELTESLHAKLETPNPSYPATFLQSATTKPVN